MAIILAAKRIDAGCEVFAYTFASPATTERTSQAAKEAVIENYSSIFNIINEDDLVPQLPMLAWDFVRYGKDKPASIETGYAGQWETLVSGDDMYTSLKTAVTSTVNILSNIAEDRNECYAYRNDEAGYLRGSNLDYNYVGTMCRAMTSTYPLCVYGYWYSTINYRPTTIDYEYRIYQQPAFLLQLMAYAMSGSVADGVNFAVISVAEYLAAGKSQIIDVRNLIQHPHYPESYYLLATKIT